MKEKRPAVFIDRDGTLNEMVYDVTHGTMDSPRKPKDVVLKKGAASFIRDARRLGYLIIVITNQPGLAKGYLTQKDLKAVNHRLLQLLKRENKEAFWDDFYFCPHYSTPLRGGRRRYILKCTCRKPKPGMILRAAREHSIDLSNSWMIGDGLVDVQAGQAAGCRTILVSPLKLELIEKFFDVNMSEPDKIAPDLERAFRFIQSCSR